ncbi:MAG: HAMP domain-containing protein, partial [Thiotrichales bacterium]|nr:HAMP domain-containing protein [Thiotrichales bacterium]
MRNNLPITQQEYVLSEGTVLVSETDVQGNITYANDAFIAVSGYSWSELKGQPHNIIRHPDVPEVVFKDLWATLKQGEPWHQFFKNRRKNGDHYWVEVNMAPVMHNGQITGYKSVRNTISREQIPRTEALYCQLAQGKSILNKGSVTSPLAAKLAALSPLPKKSILGKTMIPLVVMAILWSIVLQLYLQNVADNLYQEAVHERQDLLNKNLQSEIVSQSQIALTNAVGLAGNSALIYGLYDHQKTVIWQILQVNYDQYVKRANLHGMGLAVFDDKLQLVSNSGVKIQTSEMPSESVTRIVFQAEGVYLQAQVPVPYGDKVIGLVVVSLPLTQLSQMEAQANRQYAAFEKNQDNWQLAQGFRDSYAAQHYQMLTPSQHQELISTGYVVRDQLLYVWSSIADQNQTSVIGAHLIVEPMEILSQLLKNTYFMIYVAQAAMSGGFILLLLQVFWRLRKFILSPMRNLTEKLKIASEQGSLSVRAEVLSSDEIGLMGQSFNHYVTAVQHLMISVADMIDELSKGRLSKRIDADAKGDLNILKNYVNHSADNIQTVIQDIEVVIHSIKEGNYTYHSGQVYQGEFAQMMADLKLAMNATQSAVSGINNTMQALADGNFSERLTADLNGELAALKANINVSLDQLESGISETVAVLVAQSKGDLTQRVQG